jgi:predicted dehydrogenase
MIEAIMIGAGNRGIGAYGSYVIEHPNELAFVGVADPDNERRHYFQTEHKIKDDMVFHDAEEVYSKGKLADAVFICTQDRQHIHHVLKAMDLGYHVFLEKPMAVDPHDILKIQKKAIATKTILVVAHVLRYSPFFNTIKNVLDEGHLGKIMVINHEENVGFYHQAHSYVRGNWRNSSIASPMILAKSCHDMDIISYLLDDTPKRLSSFGTRSHFKRETMDGVPNYCLDGCPHQETCLYFAPKVYLNAGDWMKFPVSNDLSDQAILKALEKGPYGRCVYRSDNDVVDHQVVSIEFDHETTVNFSMSAFSNKITRHIHIMGTNGELWGDMNEDHLTIKPFGKDAFYVNIPEGKGGHGGGDHGAVKRFIEACHQRIDVNHDLEIAVQGHLLAFAAEKSRVSGETVDFKHFVKELS